MVNQMIIIPLDVYTNLHEREKILMNPYDISLLNYNKEMAEILADPSITDETKYAKYDQIIKKIKNILSEKSDKNSIESKITNAINSSFSAIAPPDQTQTTKIITKKVHKKPKIKLNKKIKGIIKEKNKKEINEGEEDQNSYYSAGSRKASVTEEPKPTSSLIHETGSSKRNTRNQLFEKNQTILYEYIKRNSKKFGISEDDKIFKEGNNVTYQGSDLGKLVNYMIRGDDISSRVNKPPGYDQLYKLIKNDPAAFKIIENKQSGKGLIQKKKILFKPTLWKIY